MKNQQIGKSYEINGITIKNHANNYKEISATVDKWNEILDTLSEEGGLSFYEFYGDLENAWFEYTQGDVTVDEYSVIIKGTEEAFEDFIKMIK